MSTLLTWTAAGPGGHTLQQAVWRPSDPEGIVDTLRELAHLLIGTGAVLVGIALAQRRTPAPASTP